MTINELIEQKEYFQLKLEESLDGETKSALEKILTLCEYDIPDAVEVCINVLRETFKAKEGCELFQREVSKYDDPSIRLEYKLTVMEMIFDDELASCFVLMMFHVVDDTICIEDYLDIEDAE